MIPSPPLPPNALGSPFLQTQGTGPAGRGAAGATDRPRAHLDSLSRSPPHPTGEGISSGAAPPPSPLPPSAGPQPLGPSPRSPVRARAPLPAASAAPRTAAAPPPLPPPPCGQRGDARGGAERPQPPVRTDGPQGRRTGGGRCSVPLPGLSAAPAGPQPGCAPHPSVGLGWAGPGGEVGGPVPRSYPLPYWCPGPVGAPHRRRCLGCRRVSGRWELAARAALPGGEKPS